MILYKYYSFEAGLAALKSSKLGFRKPAYFNDPFELTFLNNIEGHYTKTEDWERKLEKLKDQTLILSLTRTPLNALMWAHYGDSHTGFVIGYDVANPFLNDEQRCIIPVDQGDVVYTNTKPINKLTRDTNSRLHSVWLDANGLMENPAEIRNFSRKIFLTKHASWVYEEEVRVVKQAYFMTEEIAEQNADPMRSFDQDSDKIVPGLRLYNYPATIREVYLGLRNPIATCSEINDKSHSSELLRNKAVTERWRVCTLYMSRGTWDLDYELKNPEIFV